MSRRLLTSSGVPIVVLILMFSLCCCAILIVLGAVVWSSVLSPADLAPPVVSPTPTSVSRQVSTPAAPDTPTPFPSRASVTAPLVTPTGTRRLTPESTGDTRPLPSIPVPLPTSEERASTTEDRLLATELPQRDIRLLAERLKKTGPIPEKTSSGWAT